MFRCRARPAVAASSSAAARRWFVEDKPLISHSAQLRIDPNSTPASLLARMGRPKIIATMGPSSLSSPEVIDGMLHGGMNVARFNMSHGSHSDHHDGIKLVRQRALHLQEHVGIALDTRGPEVRLGAFAPEARTEDSPEATAAAAFRKYTHGEMVTVSVDPEFKNAMQKDLLYIDYPGLLQGPKRPTHLLIADGMLELTVQSVDLKKGQLTCLVTRGATIYSRSNVHIAGADVVLPLVSEQDEADITFGVANDVDFVFASFVRSPQQVHELRGILGTRGRRVSIVAKVETVPAMENLEAIIDAADGVMVARGDLGVALPLERAFFAQKKIIAACNLAGKPVICATQLLESMVHHRRPTRAETTDVANAAIDGADALMLSAESARGEYPVQSIQTLSRISSEAMGFIRHRKRFSDMVSALTSRDIELNADPTAAISFRPEAGTGTPASPRRPVSAGASSSLAAQIEQRELEVQVVRSTLPRTIGYIAEAAVLTSLQCQARCIITATVSGNSVRKLRQCMPKCPIIAVCKDQGVARQMSLVRGVTALTFSDLPYDNFDGLVEAAIKELQAAPATDGTEEACRRVHLATGDLVVVTCTDSTDPTDFTAYLKIRVVQ